MCLRGDDALCASSRRVKKWRNESACNWGSKKKKGENLRRLITIVTVFEIGWSASLSVAGCFNHVHACIIFHVLRVTIVLYSHHWPLSLSGWQDVKLLTYYQTKSNLFFVLFFYLIVSHIPSFIWKCLTCYKIGPIFSRWVHALILRSSTKNGIMISRKIYGGKAPYLLWILKFW